MSRAVAITGLGSVSAHGAGREVLAAALAAGVAATAEVERTAGYHRQGSARTAAIVPPLDLSAWLPPAAARRMSRPSRFAVAAARMALADAGIDLAAKRGGPTAVAIATTFSASSSTEALLREMRASGPEAASPFQFAECVANAPAAQVALSARARGANLTVMQGEAGPLLALARAAREVSAGRADLALAGAVDEVTPLVHAILDRFGALARPDRSGAERSLPFAADRDGYTLGEGASMLVLEPEAAARERGARILARVGAGAGANDPSAPAAGWGSGAAGLAAALRRLLDAAGGAPVDRIVSGASGARRGDWLEARLLRTAFDGGSLPPVHTPKGSVGEHGGGFLAAAVLAAAGYPIARPRGCDAVDPEIGLLAHAGPLPDPPARTLVTALAAGGPAAWLLLERA